MNKRIKSLVWRLTGMLGVAFLTWIAQPETVEALGIPAVGLVFSGLVVGEITKWLNRSK